MAVKSEKEVFFKNRGATLAETVVYVFLIGLMLSVVVAVLFSVSRSYRVIQSSFAIDTTAKTSLERMTREIRSSLSVDRAGSVLGSSPGKLALNTRDTSGNPLSVEFYVNNFSLLVKEAGVVLGPLSVSSARITNLVFREIPTGESTAVKIEMTVESGQGNSLREKNFYSTVVLRGAYAP